MKSKRAREAAEASPKGAEDQSLQQPAARKRKHLEIEGPAEAVAAARKKTKKEKDGKKKLKESRKEKKDKQKDLQDLPEEDDKWEKKEEVMKDGGEKEAGEKEEKRKVKEKKRGMMKMEKREKKEKKKHADVVDKDADQETRKGEREEEKKRKRKENEGSTMTESPKRTKRVNGSAKEAQDKKEKVPRAEKSDDQSQETKSEKEKRPRSEKKKKEGSNDSTLTSDPTTSAAENASKQRPNKDEDSAAAQAKADRHIVFVGNLPYTATPETLQAHFASLEPVAVRCLTERGKEQACRGIAFVEFASARAQRTCLDRFHHSLFDDGKSPARKINVELTAGGGGKTSHRKDKIREKNKALEENRSKRIEKEKTAKVKSGESKDKAQQEQQQQQAMGDSIHPSRLARNPGLGH